MALAEGTEITLDELRLAARNHAMPLEALRWPVTPVGLHYLLIHYDVPLVDPERWALEVGGAVETPLVLELDDPSLLQATGRLHTFVRTGRRSAVEALTASVVMPRWWPSSKRKQPSIWLRLAMLTA